MRALHTAAIVLTCALGLIAAAHAQRTERALAGAPLVADLSEDLIAITTGFTGTDVLLFGATPGRGDVIVVVRAPESRVVVRRKDRVAGVWVNADSLTFDGVPGFYHVASSRDLSELLPEETLAAEQIGAGKLALRPTREASANEIGVFGSALIRNKQRVGLFSSQLGNIRFLDNRLFRTEVELPSSVPIGEYTVTVYLVEGGAIVDRTETPLRVSKTGFEAQVFELANRQAAIYGAIAIFIALVAGWFAGVVFRNV